MCRVSDFGVQLSDVAQALDRRGDRMTMNARTLRRLNSPICLIFVKSK